MQGFGRPQYTNVQMPFPGPPPAIPDDNPTGVHRRTVTVPARLGRGSGSCCTSAGAESVLYVHVDGEPVGMGKDSRLPHEFDLTGVVEPGRPFELALTVVQWSDATYLEDQDHWYHAGLHRSVLLRAMPPVHIADLDTRGRLRPGHRRQGRLAVRVPVRHVDGPGPTGWSGGPVEVAGQSVAADRSSFEHPADRSINSLAFLGRGAAPRSTVPDVAPVDAPRPRPPRPHRDPGRRPRGHGRPRDDRRSASGGSRCGATSCSSTDGRCWSRA